MSSDLASSSGGGEVVHRVKNERTFPVQLYWMDYQGRAVPYGVVQPDTSLDQATYSSHAWRVCDERSGVALAEYVGPSATITLLADGSVRVEVGGAAGPAPPAPAEAAAEAEGEAGDATDAAAFEGMGDEAAAAEGGAA